MGWRWGNEVEQQNKKGGPEGKEEGGEEAQTERLASQTEGQAVNRREGITHAVEVNVWKPWPTWEEEEEKKVVVVVVKWEGEQRRQTHREQSSKLRSQHCTATARARGRFCPGRDRESITGTPRLLAGLGTGNRWRKMWHFPRLEVGEQAYGYGHGRGTVICALWVLRNGGRLTPRSGVGSGTDSAVEGGEKRDRECRAMSCSCRTDPMSYMLFDCALPYSGLSVLAVLELWASLPLTLALDRRIPQYHAERSWRYGSLAANVGVMQCITI